MSCQYASAETVLEIIRSRCLGCKAPTEGTVVRREADQTIWMRKHCAACDHGPTETRIERYAEHYSVRKLNNSCGCDPEGRGNSPTVLGENARTASQLHTCTLVVEIVDDCNLQCPTCFADSPFNKHWPTRLNCLPMSKLQQQVEAALKRQTEIDILQLSGGEPSLHPELFEIIAWAAAHPKINRTLLNTNGTLLNNRDFVNNLASRAAPERFAIYLQYDGQDEPGQRTLRGQDYRALRERALANCKAARIPVTLVMTVTRENLANCPSLLQRALPDDNIPWLVFQPEFLSGRNDQAKLAESPVSVGEIVTSVNASDFMDNRSWTKLPCGHENCGTIGFMVRLNGEWQPASNLIDVQLIAPFIANRLPASLDEISNCGCDGIDLGAIMARLGITKHDVKMVFIKPFMDARTWNEDRTDACCTHIIGKDGNLHSFCEYYARR